MKLLSLLACLLLSCLVQAKSDRYIFSSQLLNITDSPSEHHTINKEYPVAANATNPFAEKLERIEQIVSRPRVKKFA